MYKVSIELDAQIKIETATALWTEFAAGIVAFSYTVGDNSIGISLAVKCSDLPALFSKIEKSIAPLKLIHFDMNINKEKQ